LRAEGAAKAEMGTLISSRRCENWQWMLAWVVVMLGCENWNLTYGCLLAWRAAKTERESVEQNDMWMLGW